MFCVTYNCYLLCITICNQSIYRGQRGIKTFLPLSILRNYHEIQLKFQYETILNNLTTSYLTDRINSKGVPFTLFTNYHTCGFGVLQDSNGWLRCHVSDNVALSKLHYVIVIQCDMARFWNKIP